MYTQIESKLLKVDKKCKISKKSKVDMKAKQQLKTKTKQLPNTVRPQIPLGYILFNYRQDLNCSKTSFLRLFRGKAELTKSLVSKTVVHFNRCNNEELKELNRGAVFYKKLKGYVKRLQHLETMGVTVKRSTLTLKKRRT